MVITHMQSQLGLFWMYKQYVFDLGITSLFDFSFMATIEVGIMYDQIVKGTIIET